MKNVMSTAATVKKKKEKKENTDSLGSCNGSHCIIADNNDV